MTAEPRRDRQAPLLIVLAYPDGRLANPWFRAYRRISRVVRTKGLNVTVDLRPTIDLPSRVDLLVLAPGIDTASAGATAADVLTPSSETVQLEVEAYIAERLADGRLGYAPRRSRRFAVHRGFLPLDARARWGDD